MNVVSSDCSDCTLTGSTISWCFFSSDATRHARLPHRHPQWNLGYRTPVALRLTFVSPLWNEGCPLMRGDKPLMNTCKFVAAARGPRRLELPSAIQGRTSSIFMSHIRIWWIWPLFSKISSGQASKMTSRLKNRAYWSDIMPAMVILFPFYK